MASSYGWKGTTSFKKRDQHKEDSRLDTRPLRMEVEQEEDASGEEAVFGAPALLFSSADN